MAIKLLRQPSDTPNITNADDFVGLRYAYGNQSGYVKGRGSECDAEANGNVFKIKSGRLVLQGVEVDLDSNGYSQTINEPWDGALYYTCYLQVNLALQTARIVFGYSPDGYIDFPEIGYGDDLTANTTGTANMELFHFKYENNVITDISKVVKQIEYTGDMVVYGAKNSIANSNGTYGGFTTDENGVLKTGDYILEKKELLFHSDTGIDISAGVATTHEIIIGSATEDLKNKLLEFVIKDGEKWNGTGEYRFRCKMGNDGYCNFLMNTHLFEVEANQCRIRTDVVVFHVQPTANLYTLTGWTSQTTVDIKNNTIYKDTSEKKVMDVYEIIE